MIRDTKRRPEELRGVQNLPIENELKISRVYQTEPIDATCWAYMRALRQFGSTKKVYPVNPYVEVYQLQQNIFGLLTESSDGMGDPWMYLIIGGQKAMLVDTGFGLGDLKGLCSVLAPGKELIVVNTHGHPDHAYGNAQFEKVYCHEYDVPMLRAQNEHLWDYLFEGSDRISGKTIWAEFDREDIIPFCPYEIIGCPDGHMFDLGGDFEVELIHMGGHTAGCCAFLEKKTGSLFIGDDLISMRVGMHAAPPDAPYSEFMTVSTMRSAFRRLSSRKAEFSHVYTGHFATDLENTTIDSMLEACDAICSDPIGYASYSAESPEGTQYFRYVEGLGTIAYQLETV